MILDKSSKILRQKTEDVKNFNSSDFHSLIKKMSDAMFNEPDGIGIAAPQIGISKKVFLVAEDVLFLERFSENKEGKSKRTKNYFVFANPSIKKFSSKKTKDIEGCLSVRGVYGEVLRPEKITVEYFDESGNKKNRGASNLFARVIQHEFDHLNGILFIDKAKNIQRIKHEP